jgi:hypothetical protein
MVDSAITRIVSRAGCLVTTLLLAVSRADAGNHGVVERKYSRDG